MLTRSKTRTTLDQTPNQTPNQTLNQTPNQALNQTPNETQNPTTNHTFFMANFKVGYQSGYRCPVVSCRTGNHSKKGYPTHLVTLTIPCDAHATIVVSDVQVAFSNMDPLAFQCVSSHKIFVHCTDGNSNNATFFLEADCE
jgi:hypothetical protein